MGSRLAACALLWTKVASRPSALSSEVSVFAGVLLGFFLMGSLLLEQDISSFPLLLGGCFLTGPFLYSLLS